MKTRLTHVLAPAILLLAVGLAACGPAISSGPGASSSASSGASEAPSASGSTAPSAVASDAGTSPSAAVSPSAAAGGDLAATIPGAVGDVSLVANEVDADAYVGANVNRQLTPLLAAVGKSTSDVSVATATGSAAGGATLFIDAVRVNGADAPALIAAFQTAAALVPGAQVAATEVSGKSAVTVTTSSYTLGVYAVADTLYYVQSPDAALVTQGIAALP